MIHNQLVMNYGLFVCLFVCPWENRGAASAQLGVPYSHAVGHSSDEERQVTSVLRSCSREEHAASVRAVIGRKAA